MRRLLLIIVVATLVFVKADAQRRLTEATITYAIKFDGESNPMLDELLKGTSSVVYLKGQSSRSDMISPLGSQSTIIDGKTGGAVLLKDFGGQKYMIRMTPDNWKEMNSSFNNLTYSLKPETKTILGHICKKAIVALSGKESVEVYYTEDIIPTNKDFQYLNKNLPGLVMEYQAKMGNIAVTYSIKDINFNPVPQVKFDLPTSGYRVMTYDESKKMGK
jgi:GLPGLI family protein